MAEKFLLFTDWKFISCKKKAENIPKIKNIRGKIQELLRKMPTPSFLTWDAVLCNKCTERSVKPEQYYSDAFIVKVSKQLVICNVGTSQGRGCILTFVFYNQ